MDFYCSRYALALSFAPSDTSSKFIPDTPFKTEHIRLELDVDVSKSILTGWCVTDMTVLADDTRTVGFDAVDMKILEVRVGNRTAKYSYDRRRLEVTLPRAARAGSSLTVRVRYRVQHPRAGIQFLKPDKLHPRRPVQVWTQGQPDDSRCWFPCRDVPGEKATTEMVVTVPADFVAVSNGALISNKKRSAKRVFHWKMSKPHSVYLVTLTVGRFAEVRDEWNGIPVQYFCEKGREEDARRAFGKTPRALEFFSRKIGVPYPYEKYAQVACDEYMGGMENTTATTQTSNALIDERAALATDYDGLMAHELAHQWFGDTITCYDWSHAWLHESFATYFDLLFQEHDKGVDEFRYRLWKSAEAYFDESGQYQRPMVTHKWVESFDIFDRHLYPKGACILHFFRHVLGDSGWWRGIKHYIKKHQFSAVGTSDLIDAWREATGKNMDRYAEQWIYRAGHPDLRVAYEWDPRTKTAHLWIVQKQAIASGGNVYDLPVELRFHTASGVKSFHETLTQREHRFDYKLPGEPRMVLFDPDLTIPVKKVEFLKPPETWKKQLSSDPNGIGRIEAARTVASWGTSEAVALLRERFWKEKHWTVQSEIALAMGKIRGKEVFESLVKMLRAESARVRRAVVEAMGEFRSERVIDALAPVFDKDPSYHVQAEAIRSMARTGLPASRKHVQKALGMESWADLIRSTAVEALWMLDRRPATVAPYVRGNQPTMVRLSAVRLLGRMGTDPAAAAMLKELVQDNHYSVQMNALAQIARGSMMSLFPAVRKVHEKAHNGMVRAMAARTLRAMRLGMSGEFPKPQVK